MSFFLRGCLSRATTRHTHTRSTHTLTSEMPLNMAVEEPFKRVAGGKSDHKVAALLDGRHIPHIFGHERGRVRVVGARVGGAFRHDPEGLAVQLWKREGKGSCERDVHTHPRKPLSHILFPRSKRACRGCGPVSML